MIINAYVNGYLSARLVGILKMNIRALMQEDLMSSTLAPEIETHLVNAVLTNGQVTCYSPRLSTPECRCSAVHRLRPGRVEI